MAQHSGNCMSQDGVKVGSHLYSAFLKTCAAAGTPQLLDLGMAVYHDLYCHWETLYSGSTVGKAEQECALSRCLVLLDRVTTLHPSCVLACDSCRGYLLPSCLWAAKSCGCFDLQWCLQEHAVRPKLGDTAAHLSKAV